jgi:hypothetical protein
LTHGISLHKKLPTDSEECISRDPPVRKIQDYKLGEREEKMREEGNAPILNLPTEKARKNLKGVSSWTMSKRFSRSKVSMRMSIACCRTCTTHLADSGVIDNRSP